MPEEQKTTKRFCSGGDLNAQPLPKKPSMLTTRLLHSLFHPLALSKSSSNNNSLTHHLLPMLTLLWANKHNRSNLNSCQVINNKITKILIHIVKTQNWKNPDFARIFPVKMTSRSVTWCFREIASSPSFRLVLSAQLKSSSFPPMAQTSNMSKYQTHRPRFSLKNLLI